MATRGRRKSSIDRASVQAILTSGASHHAAAPPSPHVGESPNRELFAMDQPPRPAVVKHIRALSYTSRRPNRLSLSFPVATSTNSNESARPTPTSSNAPSLPDTPADAPVPSPNDTNSFLVALAGQERRVLELKEELEKAEADLDKLKKQWARHEASKKRAEIRHSEPLRPLHAVTTERDSSNEEGSVTRQSAEIDRRKALLSNMHKESRRKVLSGGHTRTLSLLSPERATHGQPFPFPPLQESGSESDTSSVPRSTTMPDTSQGITKVSSNRARHSYQGGVTHNAKQIAEDVKAGLWTFLEDLRQATVGDEGINGTTNRASLDPMKDPQRKGSRSSLLSNERGRHAPPPRPSDMSPRTWDSLTGSNPALLDAAGTMWEEMDQSRSSKSLTPLKQKSTAKKLSTAPLVDDLDDDWSNWDTPTPKSPRWSGSTTELTDPATPSNSNGADGSVKIVDQSTDESSPPLQREEIQWPALDRLTPGHLKRTMSTLIKDWEKSLTAPPDERVDPMSGGSQRSESRSPPLL